LEATFGTKMEGPESLEELHALMDQEDEMEQVQRLRGGGGDDDNDDDDEEEEDEDEEPSLEAALKEEQERLERALFVMDSNTGAGTKNSCWLDQRRLAVFVCLESKKKVNERFTGILHPTLVGILDAVSAKGINPNQCKKRLHDAAFAEMKKASPDCHPVEPSKIAAFLFVDFLM